jgi:hypothetical protein
LKRLLAHAVLVAGLTALAQPAMAAPPEPVDSTPILIEAGDACAFPIELVLNGKGKIIDVGGETRQIATSPGLKLKVTNVTTGESVSYVITGTFHNATLPNGNVVTIATGRNALFDAVAGFVITTGRFTYTTAPDGTNVEPLRRLGGPEPVNICDELAP